MEYFHFGQVVLREILHICWQFISTSINFCRYVLLFRQMALIFQQVLIVFTVEF